MPAKMTQWYLKAREFLPWLWLVGFILSSSWAADALKEWLEAGFQEGLVKAVVFCSSSFFF